jgi:hypothetical protein
MTPSIIEGWLFGNLSDNDKNIIPEAQVISIGHSRKYAKQNHDHMEGRHDQQIIVQVSKAHSILLSAPHYQSNLFLGYNYQSNF